MSGIAGIAHLDGGSPDRQLLLQMARSLSFRGPDRQEIWTDRSAGLAYSAHLVSGDNTRALGLENLGHDQWIAADARLDAREDLVMLLRAAGQHADLSCSDSRLLLYAYEAWGEDSVRHVSGEFAFGIWDARRRQCFCACDHFGIRQLYFSQLPSFLVFSNTLACVRMHPGVSDRLNDAAICDFLLFGLNTEEGTTSFADIHRLPRAHWLKWSVAGLEIQEYWRPPTDGEIRYKKREEYVEHFDELFGKAVADRIRGDTVGVLLSGGIDSSSVAAVCNEVQRKRGKPKLHAFTVVGPGPSDPDEAAARSVADALQIPFHILREEDGQFFQQTAHGHLHWPEPIDDPAAASVLLQAKQVAENAGVVLSGEGSDNLMTCEPGYYLLQTWRRGNRKQAAIETAQHLMARFRAPDGLTGPLRRIGRIFSEKPASHPPAWIKADLVERLGLNKRWAYADSIIPRHAHSEHPAGYASLFLPQWRSMFESVDAAYTRAALHVRYPFLDLRVVRYLLSIPAIPWFFRKFLLREAMRGRLPEKIRKRAKIPLKRDPTPLTWKRPSDPLREKFWPELQRYVDRKAFEVASYNVNPETAEMDTRVWCLGLWLMGLRLEKTATQPTAPAPMVTLRPQESVPSSVNRRCT